MSNKLLYGLLGVLGVGAIGTVIYNSSLDEEESKEDKEVKRAASSPTPDVESEENTQEGGEPLPSINEETTTTSDETYSMPDIDLSEIFQIQFENPDQMIPKKEKKSKLLKTNSPLYSVLSVYRSKLLSTYGEEVSEQRMDFHIELVKRSEEWTETKLLDRTQELEGRYVDLADTEVWNVGRHSVTIKTGRVMGYGNTHITLAYFKNGVPEDVEDVLFEIDDETEALDEIDDDQLDATESEFLEL